MNTEEALSLLGISADATDEEIDAAYARAIYALNPDDAEMLNRYNEAIELLKDSARGYPKVQEETPQKPSSPPETQRRRASQYSPKTSDPDQSKSDAPFRKRFSDAFKDEFEHWKILWSSLSCHPVTWVLFAPVILMLAPSLLLVIPLVTAIAPKVDWPRPVSFAGLIVANLAALAVVLSPYFIVNTLEQRYQTDELCQVCGRPGKEIKYWREQPKVGYSMSTSDPQSPDIVNILCPVHESSAPDTISSKRSGIRGTAGSGVTGSCFACALYWVVALFFTSGISHGSLQRKFWILAPAVFVIAAVVSAFNWQFVMTLISP